MSAQRIRNGEPEPVTDYPLVTDAGTKTRLFDLLDGKEDLILIDSMDRSCTSCTMWTAGLAFKEAILS